MQPRPIRLLFVFARLVGGRDETEVRLLARTLDPAEYRIGVVVCFRQPGLPELTGRRLAALGIDVDDTPCALSFEDTVGYLAQKVCAFDVVISCQNVADIYPALEMLHWRPPLIEYGRRVSEALAGPKHFTSRYIGVCRSIRDAAATKMPGRTEHAVEIPSMVDLDEFSPLHRAAARASLGIAGATPLVGWVGPLDAKWRVEDFIEAAALVHAARPDVRFVVVGGPDASTPDQADMLAELAFTRGLSGVLTFLGDRDDVPALLSAMDILVWLSRGEGMPQVLAEAGAAALPVIATPDDDSAQTITDQVSGLFVPHESAPAVAGAIEKLLRDPSRGKRLGLALRARIATTTSADVVVPQWKRLVDAVLRERAAAPAPSIFASFIQGGFECSTHRRRDGRRLDLIAATGHDANAAADYRQLREHGIVTVRDGLRWHRIEIGTGRYDWSSLLPMLGAARVARTQVIWDLMHYGWPDDIDIWSPAFVTRFSRFAAAAARVIKAETDLPPFYCPINEISFHAWGGGDGQYLNPFARGRGFELKVQLARAAIAAMHEILIVDPRARFVHCEPVINIAVDPARPLERLHAEGARLAQYQTFDLISGAMWPQLGGEPALLDVVGVNYYPNNQWIHGGPPIDERHASFRPFRTLLAETHARYGRPVLVSETGTEGGSRADWFDTIAGEVEAARCAGIPVEGICLYPVVDHVGWDDDRDCPSGLLANRRSDGRRLAHQPLAAAIERWHRQATLVRERVAAPH